MFYAHCRHDRGWAFWAAVRFPLALLTASGAATLLSLVLKWAVGRVRPALLEGHLHLMPLAGLAGMDSFPSSQAAFFGALAMAFAIRWPGTGPVWLVQALAVGSLRVLAGMHWTSDVLAGLTLGAATALIVGRTFSARPTRAST